MTAARPPSRDLTALPMTWVIHRERLLLLGWGTAILLQFAHPLVANAVAEHSGFRTQWSGGWRRLHRTLRAMLRLTFGSPEEARAAGAAIRAVHGRVQGKLGAGAGAFDAGTPYTATDPELLRWVHATCVYAFMRTFELYVHPLTAAQRDAYCEESAEGEALLGAPAGCFPRTLRGLDDYMTAMLADGPIAVTDAARELAGAVLHPRGAWLGGPLTSAVRWSAIGLLPAEIRRDYGFRWSEDEERRFGRLVRSVRGLRRVAPGRLCYWRMARRRIAAKTDAILRAQLDQEVA